MQDDALKNRLQERFEAYTSTPSEGVWEGIESVLNEDDKKQSGWFWWFSPLGLSILAGTSAAALAFFFWIPSEKVMDTFPAINSIRSVNATLTMHNKIEQAPTVHEVVHTPNQTTHREEQGTNHTAPIAYSTVLPNFRFALPPYDLMIGNETSAAVALDTVAPLNIEAPFFDQLASLDHEKPHRRWELQMTATGFVRNASANSVAVPEESDGAIVYANTNGTKFLQRHQRFGEFEMSGICYLSRKVKMGVGFSGAYSDEDGKINEQTLFATTQWTFGIPVQVGVDLFQGKRFELSAVTKILNDWEFRKSEIVKASETIAVPDPAPSFDLVSIAQDPITEKGTAYRFGVQPTLVVSYAIQPQLAISLGVGYRAYLADTRSNVNFDKSNYGTLSLGLVKRW